MTLQVQMVLVALCDQLAWLADTGWTIISKLIVAKDLDDGVLSLLSPLSLLRLETSHLFVD